MKKQGSFKTNTDRKKSVSFRDQVVAAESQSSSRDTKDTSKDSDVNELRIKVVTNEH